MHMLNMEHLLVGLVTQSRLGACKIQCIYWIWTIIMGQFWLPRVAQTHVTYNAYIEYGPFLWADLVTQNRSDACKIQCIY